MTPKRLLTTEDIFKGTIEYRWFISRFADVSTMQWEPELRTGYVRDYKCCYSVNPDIFFKMVRDVKQKQSNPFYPKEEG